MIPVKEINHSWGTETTLGEGTRVVRIYKSTKKVTLDLSQVRDHEWSLANRVFSKHNGATKVVLPPDTDVAAIVHHWTTWWDT